MSILIKNGKFYSSGRLVEKNILIQQGKIKKFTSESPQAETIINASNKIILPGFIDPHVHFREPGLTQKGDFLTESKAAAKGGVTSIIDMPNTIPPTTTVELLQQKRDLASKSIVNYGFHFGSKENNIEEIKKAKNIASVKLYMDFTTGDLKIDSHEYITELLKYQPITALHAEPESINYITEIATKEKIQNELYFCHISSELELKNTKKSRNLKTFVEVTPHHLFMTKKDVQELGSLAEMKPSLKTPHDQKYLWHGIKKGWVDTIGTDHAPHTLQEKKQGNYPFGVPGVETVMPLMLDAVSNKQLELSKAVELCSENPAKIFKIKNKGFIKENYDADLVVVDLNNKREVVGEELLTKPQWSPFEGKKLKGWPTHTVINGEVIYQEGSIFNLQAKELEYER
tara:strand:- start:15651 stop:16853 length:1203 start_codon:yes stop_codon:yes gene_type:complete